MGLPIGLDSILRLPDEPPSQGPCIHTSSCHDFSNQTMIISTPSTVESSSSSYLYPFDFNSRYESVSDEAAFLTRAMAQWLDVTKKVPFR